MRPMALEQPLAAPGPRTLTLAVVTAAMTGGLAVLAAVVLDMPLRDPDGFLGPSWVRMPLIVGLCLVVDVVPRAALRARGGRGGRGLLAECRAVAAVRWPWRRLVPVLVAVASFYTTYVGYRNLKSFLPFVRTESEDLALAGFDRALMLGHNPADLLHTVLGTGVAAHVLSAVYMSFLVFVPISVVASLIWSKQLNHGLWYVTALCLNWTLGAASYYALPASGPFYALPWDFMGLPPTDVRSLQDSLVQARDLVLVDPHATARVSGIAAFASLHVSIIFTAALTVQLVRLPALVRRVVWTYFALTVTATVYFGWHYVADDIAGLLIGAFSVVVAGWATGQLRLGGQVPAERPAEPERERVSAG